MSENQTVPDMIREDLKDLNNIMPSALDDKKMAELRDLVEQLVSVQDDISFAEIQIKELKKKAQELSQIIIPDKMAELGFNRIVLHDGSDVSIVDGVAATIAAKNKAAAFRWLRDHGYDDIIKNEVITSFGKGEEQRVNKLIEVLETEGYNNFTRKESVHPSTLKAFIKEQIESGNKDFVGSETEALNLFGVYQYKQTRIKKGATNG